MKFYCYKFNKIPNLKNFPLVLLISGEWDDFSYRTSFNVKYYDKGGKEYSLGDVKILKDHYDNEDENIVYTRDYIPEKFTRLDSNFCSLGQSIGYYELLKKLGRRIALEILRGLNDVATNDEISGRFKDLSGFRNSLIRFSDAEKAFKEARVLFHGKRINKILKFDFNYQILNAEKKHNISLDFNKIKLPHRINAFIGKNATGKTVILKELAGRLSGIIKNEDNFYPERPSFGKIIAISYSAFDEFYKPFEIFKSNERDTIKEDFEEDEMVLFSYVYCGLRTKRGIVSQEDLENNFFKAYNEIMNNEKEKDWLEIMNVLLGDENIEEIKKINGLRIKNSSVKSLIDFLSSGQNILLTTMTEVIVNIEFDSLLLFDEPEMHLHPNAIANFMRMFYKLLEKFNSFAILSTHSPLIIQEIPAKYIKVFNRDVNTPYIENLYKESFGENISNLTNDVFDVREHESNYKTWFRMMTEKTKYKEEIIDLFENELSYNALTFLNSLYFNKNERGKE